MKFLGFIPVRTSSSRLPRKALLKIRGKRVISHVIERAKLIQRLSNIVICTSDQPEDEVFATIAKEHNILSYRGSLEDKLTRFYLAAITFGADYIVVLDADDLFFDPELIELAIKQAEEEEVDVLKSPEGLVIGAFAFIIKTTALKHAVEIKNTTNTEMYETHFLETKHYKVSDLKINDPIFFNHKARLTLDYPEDFVFFKRVFSEFKMDVNNIPLRVILKLLQTKPKIADINLFRHKDYLAKRELMRQILKSKHD